MGEASTYARIMYMWEGYVTVSIPDAWARNGENVYPSAVRSVQHALCVAHNARCKWESSVSLWIALLGWLIINVMITSAAQFIGILPILRHGTCTGQ